MGLIREVSQITRALEDNSKLTSLKEQKRQLDIELNEDIIETCRFYIYDLIDDDRKDDIILKLNENVSNIADEILERKTEKVEEYAINGEKNWKKKKVLVNKYNINDIVRFENIVKDTYIKEYKSILQELKFKTDIDKETLKERLKLKFYSLLSLHDNKLGIFNQLTRREIKDKVILEISDIRNEIKLLDSMYYKVLNEVKREYQFDIQQYKEIQKQQAMIQRMNQRQRKAPKIHYGGLLMYGGAKAFNKFTHYLTKKR